MTAPVLPDVKLAQETLNLDIKVTINEAVTDQYDGLTHYHRLVILAVL
jgi:hypothetical protein